MRAGNENGTMLLKLWQEITGKTEEILFTWVQKYMLEFAVTVLCCTAETWTGKETGINPTEGHAMREMRI
jgi:hypothetical protein